MTNFQTVEARLDPTPPKINGGLKSPAKQREAPLMGFNLKISDAIYRSQISEKRFSNRVYIFRRDVACYVSTIHIFVAIEIIVLYNAVFKSKKRTRSNETN
jgi:hypothetical protein